MIGNAICSDTRIMLTYAVTAVIIIILIVCLYSAYLRCSIRLCESKASMIGRVVIVTGANTGIGFYTALDLARRGAKVILACRDEGRGTAAQRAIIKETGNENVVYKKLDLCSLNSVRKFAADLLGTEERLHILINNAGMSGSSDVMTKDNIVYQMQANYYGHFLLTLLLLPLLKRSKPARIINLSSILHFIGDFNPRRINEPGQYNEMLGYSNSKLCMLLFSMELSRRLEGSGVVSNAVHPGVILTNITSNLSAVSRFSFWLWTFLYNRTAEQGAQTSIYLAVDEECGKVSGGYYVDCAKALRSWKALNKNTARELWEYSEKLVGYSDL